MFTALLPRGVPFFELLLQQNGLLCTAAAGLVTLLEDQTVIDDSHRAISLLEEEADALYISIIRHLSQTFITPIDREDILHINKAQEEAIDLIQNITMRIHIFEFSRVRFPMLKLAETLHSMTLLTNSMLKGLSRKKDSHDTKKFRSLRNECETLLSVGLMELFDKEGPTPGDMLQIIKWSQAYDRLELAVERVVQLAETIEEAVLKNV